MNLLFVSHFPPSPPTFGAQRRIQGLMKALARRHRVSSLSMVSEENDFTASQRVLKEYCANVVLVPRRHLGTLSKRVVQARSLFSRRSFVRLLLEERAVRRALEELLTTEAFDVVNVELPFLGLLDFRRAPPGKPLPRLILDEHNIEFDLARQQARANIGLARRFYNAVNWRRLRREELAIWSSYDGVAFCSTDDQARATQLVPTLRSAVVPNAVDLNEFRPAATASDGRTVLFFGAINYFPNEDGLRWLLREVWPRIEAAEPNARLKIIGQFPTPEILAFRSPRVEVAGRVDSIQDELAAAAVSIAPLRIGGGTRFKILEAMAMGRAVVSTSVGMEGIAAQLGRHILAADEPAAFADAVCRVLRDPVLGASLGANGRALVEERYSWDAAVQPLEEMYAALLRER